MAQFAEVKFTDSRCQLCIKQQKVWLSKLHFLCISWWDFSPKASPRHEPTIFQQTTTI